MTRRVLLRLAGAAVLVATPVTRAAIHLWRRAGQVRAGVAGGPVITVITLPEDGIPGPSDLAG